MDNILKINTKVDTCLTSEFCSVDNISNNLHQFEFAHVKNLLAPELMEQLYAEILQLDNDERLTIAAIGRGDKHILRQSIRTDKTKWLEFETPAQILFLASLDMIRLEINKSLMLGLFHIEAHYTLYKPGDYYKRHSDSFVGQKNRVISMIVYFNKEWKSHDGGLLNLYKNKDSITPFTSIIPEWGHSVLFLSENIPHEVTTSLLDRYSIAVWFHCRKPL